MSMRRLWRLGNIVEAQQFDAVDLANIFALTDRIRERPEDYDEALRKRIVATLFYEPSTRTRMSFESAVLRLGGNVITTESAGTFSSKAKGETLEDTNQVVDGYADLIVLRYYKEGGAARAKQFSSVPVINAGDGKGQHPTQALLDVYTIRQRFGTLDGRIIAFVGDLANGRTVHSLAYLLAKHYPQCRLMFVSPEAVALPGNIREYLIRKGVRFTETRTLDDAIGTCDVFYQTRVQSERFQDNPMLYERVSREAEAMHLTLERVQLMRHDAIILHPLPRVREISYDVDQDERAWYFRQAKNGLYVRMALLLAILNPESLNILTDC